MLFTEDNLKNLFKKKTICILLVMLMSLSFSFTSHSETNANISYNINPYYNYWKNNFIIYVDNYLGDINNVSQKDLQGSKGSSNVFIFTKLTNGSYNYDTLMEDIKNTDINTNLHDKKPILVHLPKGASNNESHALLKSDDEKGKLVSGGPYSKYEKYSNGFYYKDKKLDKTELNKLLSEYKIESDKISDNLKQINSFCIKDIYPNVFVAYMTNGATNVAGTPDAKIYLLNVDKKISPYNLSILDLVSKDVISGSSTKDYLPDWQSETIYVYGVGNRLIDKVTFYDFKQSLWNKQEAAVLEWIKSLNN